MTTVAMRSGLQRRLLLLLLLPLGLFALVSIYFDYQTAGSVALQKDQQLLRLIPLLADSVLSPGVDKADIKESAKSTTPLLLLAPQIEDFIKERQPSAGFRISNLAGGFLAGELWIDSVVPTTREPEFHSIENKGIIYRIAAQRVQTAAGELIVQLADGSDARQQWVRSIWVKVLLPNLVLVLAAGFVVNWAVTRALKPLNELTDAVESRSPRDLSAIDAQSTPAEVQPLVIALNRLLGLVNDQAEGQRRFVADAAHQLRTPLAGLQAQVEAWAQASSMSKGGKTSGNSVNQGVANGVTEGSVTLSADKIIKLRNATRRTSQLANQLLALSRADALAVAAQPMQLVDLKDLCESILAQQLDAATQKGIDLGLEAEPAQACGHEWLLRELLSNLVDNAVKYTPAGGSVTIRCGVMPSLQTLPSQLASAFLEVLDDGPGISANERTKVLERFYRVLGTVGEGNGLGLAIADEIARVHKTQLLLSDAQPAGLGTRGLRVRLNLRPKQQVNPHPAA